MKTEPSSRNNNSESLPSATGVRGALLIERLGRLVRAEAQDGDLNPVQWEVLRYVGRANRFSRTPAALAEYLGSTRGTVSQTIISLETKGYVVKEPSRRDGRSIELGLTRAGKKVLARDGLNALAKEISKLRDAPQLVALLERTLNSVLARRGGRLFGICRTCVHFQRDFAPGEKAPHHCRLLAERLADEEADLICLEQTGVRGNRSATR